MNAELYNLQLQEFSGQTKCNKVLNQIFKYLFDYRDPNARPLSSQEKALVYGTDKEDQILEIGASDPKDLYTNNYGELLAGICQPVSLSNLNSRTYKDQNNIDRTLPTRRGSGNGGQTTMTSVPTNNVNSDPIGSAIQFGQGTTAPTKTDFKITTELANSPEKDITPTNSSLPPFNSGLGSFNLSTQILGITDSVTIKEVVLIRRTANFSNTPADLFDLLYAHDLVTPNVSVNAGNNINGEYVMSVGS